MLHLFYYNTKSNHLLGNHIFKTAYNGILQVEKKFCWASVLNLWLVPTSLLPTTVPLVSEGRATLPWQNQQALWPVSLGYSSTNRGSEEWSECSVARQVPRLKAIGPLQGNFHLTTISVMALYSCPSGLGGIWSAHIPY